MQQNFLVRSFLLQKIDYKAARGGYFALFFFFLSLKTLHSLIPLMSGSMLTMGKECPSVACLITYTGQGPIISTVPTALDFDEVQVLQEQVMDFLIINDSPIPAGFKTSMVRRIFSRRSTSFLLKFNEISVLRTDHGQT